MKRRDALKQILLGSGVAVSSLTLFNTMQARAASTLTQWQPGYFTSHQYLTIQRLTETILPKTDLPGAIDVGVPQYLDLLYQDIFQQAERELLQQGLKRLDSLGQSRFSGPFASLTPEQQHQFLSELYQQQKGFDQAFSNRDNGKKLSHEDQLFLFLHSLRQLTIEGYYTSELVGETALAYDPIPGSYQGCMKIDNNTKVWSLDW